jgi:hypothetical protein
MPGLILAIRKVIRLKVPDSDTALFCSILDSALSTENITTCFAELDLWSGEVLVGNDGLAHEENYSFLTFQLFMIRDK